jgi:hypothetical protein
MRAYNSAVFALVAFTLEALPVGAQDVKTVEVTPYVALGSAAASPVGVAVTFPVTSTLSVETEVAYRRGEGNINAEFKHQSAVFPSARRSSDIVCRRGSWAGAIRGARVLLQRWSSDWHSAQPGHDRERWRRPEDANE